MDACTPDPKVPSLEAVNSALLQLLEDSKRLNDEEERFLVRRHALITKVHICIEALQAHIPPGTAQAPEGRFPELNHHGD